MGLVVGTSHISLGDVAFLQDVNIIILMLIAHCLIDRLMTV